ncbi:2-oxoglutarate dehydrogenase, E2 component, dihydrolipoamide succinyltransferase [Ornithinimicrobium cryptoxanthini]|uniref:Dihydrolipoamide acetyltransferase component of pyruvate dehydrogenase complex n=1 Tax=Ornithinimicrobium cryptoxanthini TaxID=2934161 RepID=A0ABY4YLF8_9MICO|nr:2-oxoglutarate dehydrogenase, E2 component, dihydrolipoamide succinyltransferase [Ornithinimicrobium cryptoxanthini]USQ77519.1 2-oxoglutarate dehydrogenase, E2 component, dihydrolipoamide succinyltransferase [Ornithinimicrobium cryptoxanthini]
MSERVTMPALGESVTEGTVTRWLKNVGDTVEVDEPLLEVSTDKVDTEIPSPVAGVLQEILAEEDDTVEVGGDLAVIGDGSDSGGSDDGGASEEASEEPAEEPAKEESAEEPAKEEPAEEPAAEEPAKEETTDEPAEEPAQSSDSGSSDSGSSDSGGGDSGGEGETVTMPALGESVTEGTVTRWLKAEGDSVEVDEPLLEVSTDKVDTEIPSPVAGVLTKILAQEDETVEVGGDLAVVGGSGGGSSESAPAAEEPAKEEPAEEPAKDEPAKEEPAKDEKAAEEEQQGATEDTPDLAEDAELHDKAAEESAAKDSGDAKAAPPSGDAPNVATGVGTPSQSGGDVSAYVTPLVRKLAAQHKVDLNTLSGTGVGGRIRKQDVLDAARQAEESAKTAASAPAPAAEQAPAASAPATQAPAASSGTPARATEASPKRGTTEKMTRLRKLIAKRMVESLQTSAQLTTVIEVDLTKVARLRNKSKEDFLAREGVKLSFMPFFVLAAVEALKVHPNVNASVEDESVIYHPTENVGIAVDTEKGLIVPVIKDAGDLNIAGISRKVADLAERTRTNKVLPDELGGGTFTITNTGSRGALFDTPIINQPQVAILGTGSVVKRPVVVVDEDGGETIAIRSMVYLALTYDHRIVDGADAARFLGTMKERLEEGSFEV